MKHKIAIIGPKKVTAGFRALGVSVFNAENGDQALEHLQSIKKNTETDSEESFAVVILIEKLLKEIPADEYEKVGSGALPAIVVLPGVEGATGEGIAKLRRLAERAAGSDILG